MLSYEEELAISEKLVARRQALQRLGLRLEAGRVPQAEIAQMREEIASTGSAKDLESFEQDVCIISAGNEAASELVLHYIPFIRRIAREVADKFGGRWRHDLDELTSVGVLAAFADTGAFNAIGSDGHPGVRFATYCSLDVAKRITRYISSQMTSMKVDLDLVQSTFIWRSTYDELKAQLGRPPTDAEVEFRSQVPRERVYDRPFLVSEEESVEDTNPGLEQYVEEDGIEMVAAKWYERQLTKVLLGVLSEVVGGDEILRVLLSTLGLDRGVPRSTSEVASHLGIGPRKTRQLELLGYDTLKHPMYRGQFQRVLVNIESREDLVD